MRHEKAWYVLQVLTGMEQASAERLRQAGMRAEAPVMVLQERRHGKWWPVRRTVFPGYVFVYTEMRDRTYYHIKQLPGVRRWLGVSGPETVPEEQMEIIGLFANGGLDFGVSQGEKRDDRTAVTSGPLAKLEGRIVKVNARARRATVQVPLLGESYLVDVGIVVSPGKPQAAPEQYPQN